jgi:uncharacterized protein
MIKIGLLSDTHGVVPKQAYDFFASCNEIWHAGDLGSALLADEINAFKPLRAVYGNIDGHEIRYMYPEINIFTIQKVKVVMMHIGGYPGRYEKKAREAIRQEKPQLFISGHSHILKVIFDQTNQLLHINPGAAGNSGLHRKITLVRFDIDQEKISNLEIFEKDR